MEIRRTLGSEKPRLQKFNLPNGSKELLAGTLMISSPQAPGFNGESYKEPKIVVVIDKK